jgi:hypothetical protein
MPWPDLPPFSAILSGLNGLDESLPEFLSKVYRHVEALRGRDDAKKLWAEIPPKKKRGKHGKRKKNLMPDRDSFLLREYDRASRRLTPREVGRLPRILGQLYHKAAPGRLGPTAETITRRLRELIRKRKKGRGRAAARSGGTVLSGAAIK